jgi:hypothetical protein
MDKFIPPTREEVRAHWQENNLNGDPDDFFDHFDNCRWKLSGGRGPVMKDWRIAARRWSRHEGFREPIIPRKILDKPTTSPDAQDLFNRAARSVREKAPKKIGWADLNFLIAEEVARLKKKAGLQ